MTAAELERYRALDVAIRNAMAVGDYVEMARLMKLAAKVGR